MNKMFLVIALCLFMVMIKHVDVGINNSELEFRSGDWSCLKNIIEMMILLYLLGLYIYELSMLSFFPLEG